MSRLALSLSWLLIFCAGARAQNRVLDLVPADCGGALMIKGIDELKQKGDKFIADTKVENLGRPSQLFDMIFQNLGIQGGVHGKLPTGLVLAAPKSVGVDKVHLGTLEQLFVVVIPFSNLDELSKNFGFKPGQLKPNVITQGKGQTFGTQFYVKGDHLYLANNPKAILAVVNGESLLKKLDAEQVRLLGDPDAMLMLNNRTWTDIFSLLGGNPEELVEGAPAEEKEIVREVVDSLRHLHYVMINVRVDGGIGGSLLTVFDKGKHASVEKLLARLRGQGTAANLNALPDGNVLAAQALQGDGAQNTAVVKALLNIVFRQHQVQALVNYAHRPNMIGAFTEVMQHLKGVRFAVYHNPIAKNVGHLSAVAMLETDDSAKFLSDIKELAKFADSDNLDLTPKTGGDNIAAVRKLVGDLGSNYYRLREAAMVRLALIGERALPFLEDSLASKDLEVSQRARKLQEQILTTAAERRKELLSDDIFKRIKPRLQFSAKSESWQGHDVYTAYVQLDDAKSIEAQLQDVLGPEWQRVRFAVKGKQVAVLFGSNRELLETALNNLQENKPGLAASKAFADFTRHSNAKRNFEIHVAARAIVSLVNPIPPREREDLAKNVNPTSLSMTVGTDRIQLDLWVPPQEFALFWKTFQ